MPKQHKFNVSAWLIFTTTSVSAALLFFLADFLSPNFNGDGLYWKFTFDHIFFAEIFGLASSMLYVLSMQKQKIKPWAISSMLTGIFIALSFVNYYSNYSIPATESDYRQDVGYTCIDGEMVNGSLTQTKICVLREIPHEDADYLVHLHIRSFTNISGLDTTEVVVFFFSQLVIFSGPTYFAIKRKVQKS